jgi:1-carboxybiuret hydrolase subunit AtzG-like
MTRRPKKAQALRKPSRKAAKPARRAKKVTRKLGKKKVAKPPQPGSLDDFIAAGARALRLKIDKAWRPTVRSHLEDSIRHGALVASFALPDETDPAPVFEA